MCKVEKMLAWAGVAVIVAAMAVILAGAVHTGGRCGNGYHWGTNVNASSTYNTYACVPNN